MDQTKGIYAYVQAQLQLAFCLHSLSIDMRVFLELVHICVATRQICQFQPLYS